MARATRPVWLGGPAFLAAALAVAPARAVDRHAEGAARVALRRAAGDYLAMRYAAAAQRLERALAQCEETRCSAATRAALLRDLGTMQFRAGDREGSRRSWLAAIALAPTLALSPSYDEADLHAAWLEAKAGGRARAAPPPPARPAGKGSPTPSSPAGIDPSDCPPGIPGCGASVQPRAGAAPGPDESAEDPSAYARWWVGAAGAIDFLLLPVADDVCKLSSRAEPLSLAHFYCTNPDGSDFPTHRTSTQNDDLPLGQNAAGRSSGGIGIGNVRALLAVDYAWSAHLLTGVRLGYVFGTYPGAICRPSATASCNAAVSDGRAFSWPVHAEARVTVLIGREPLARAGLSAMTFLGGGVSEFDQRSPSFVRLTSESASRPVNVWLTNGPFFVTLGAGVRFQPSRHVALTAAARLDAALGGNGVLPALGPELAIQVGF